jgi:hypothetical protein
MEERENRIIRELHQPNEKRIIWNGNGATVDN